MSEFEGLPRLIGKALERVRRFRPRASTTESPPRIKLKPGSKIVYGVILDVLEREQPMDVPPWIEEAVSKTIDFAKREKACAFPGNAADLSHGHLLILKEAEGKPFKQQMNEAVGILFHSQECLDARTYGLDPLKRNLFYDRRTGEVKILDPRKFDKVKPSGAIDSDNVREGIMGGATIFFEMDRQGELTFCSWDNWPRTR